MCFVRKSGSGRSEAVAADLAQCGSHSASCGTFVFEKHIKMSEVCDCYLLVGR